MAETMEKRNYDSATSWQGGLLSTDDPAVYLVRWDEHPTVSIQIGTKLTHGAVAGSGFVLGETVTGGTSGRTGVVAYVDSDHVYVVGEIGANAWDDSTPDTITGAASGSTADISATESSEARVEESHSPHDADVVAYKKWPFGDQSAGIVKTLYGGARWLRFSAISGMCVFEVNR